MIQTLLKYQYNESIKFFEFLKNIKKHKWDEFIFLCLMLTIINISIIICLTLITFYIIIYYFIRFFYIIILSIMNIHKHPKPGDFKDGIDTRSNESNRDFIKDLR